MNVGCNLNRLSDLAQNRSSLTKKQWKKVSPICSDSSSRRWWTQDSLNLKIKKLRGAFNKLLEHPRDGGHGIR